MTGRLQDQIAVVTGGASGIGRATTLRMLDEGARVLFADLNEKTAEDTLKEAAAAGHAEHILFAQADVTDEAAVSAFMDTAVERWGRIDIAFLNAGVGGAFGPITETTVAEWDATFAYLVRSVFLGIKHAVRHMRPRGSGAIIATASVAGLAGGAGSHAYSAAKAAVVNLVKSTAIELAADHIRINAVAPGLIATPLAHVGKRSIIPDVSGSQPWPETGQAGDIAGAVVFLASADAGFMTGTTVVVDGGLTANGANIWGKKTPHQWRPGMNRGTTGLASDVRTAPRQD